MEIKMKKRQDGQYATFILDDATEFYMTGYKILKKQEDIGLLPCFKERYNGQIKLLYPISGLLPLSYDAISWKKEDIRKNIVQIISIFKALTENGFLQPETVQPDLDFMFIDKESGRIYLIALPINAVPEPDATQKWLKGLKNTFLSMIGFCCETGDDMLTELKSKVIRDARSLDALCSGWDILTKQDKSAADIKTVDNKIMRLVLVSPAKKFDLEVNKPEFIIGKMRGSVDGLIDLTPTVSRKHCRITYRDGRFYIQDLGSANCTYVNDVMLSPMQSPVEIKDRDHIRLAELEFKVQLI